LFNWSFVSTEEGQDLFFYFILLKQTFKVSVKHLGFCKSQLFRIAIKNNNHYLKPFSHEAAAETSSSSAGSSSFDTLVTFEKEFVGVLPKFLSYLALSIKNSPNISF